MDWVIEMLLFPPDSPVKEEEELWEIDGEAPYPRRCNWAIQLTNML